MITVVKIGGNVIDNPEALDAFLRDFAALGGAKILVHGGGADASRMMRRLGMEPRMVDGRRVTDEATLRIAAMVYAGWIGKSIVASLQALGVDAVGLAGCDGGAVRSAKRPVGEVDFGFVGDPVAVGVPFLTSLLDGGRTPVLCAITHDGAGQLLNTNADTVAATVAAALGGELVYCFEKEGVMVGGHDLLGSREEAGVQVLPSLSAHEYAALRASGEVVGGMIAKLDNAFAALRAGARSVVIKRATDLLRKGTGTEIRSEE